MWLLHKHSPATIVSVSVTLYLWSSRLGYADHESTKKLILLRRISRTKITFEDIHWAGVDCNLVTNCSGDSALVRKKIVLCQSAYANLVFPIGWLIHGIVYLTGLFLLIPLTHLKLDCINFGTVKILYMILEHSCREPEVVVKCCVRNFSNLVYCKVILRCGHRGFGLRS